MTHYIAHTKHSLIRSGLILGLALTILAGMGLAASAALLPPVQFFYVPLPEQSTRDYLASVNTSRTTNSTVRSVISIVATGANTVIYYDHWEDGYELDLANPVQASTRIWGDNNPANGNVADVCAACVGDTLNAGNVIALINDVPLPRNTSNILYDGRDYLGATKAVAVSRSEWATTPGTVLAGAVEIYDVSRFGANFTIPVGQNLASNQMFELTALMVMADQNGTVVQIDKDGNGSVDLTTTLNKGENYKVASGINAGATVTASKPVQVHLLTADVGSSYETRWFTIYPIDEWSSSYFAPVGTTDADDPADVWVYNPGPAAISVNYDTLSGSGTLAVAGNAAVRLQMPANSGAHFYTSNGAKFFAIGTVDSDQSGTGNQTHDWGYSLVPESNLTTVAVVGWGPGSDDQNATPGPDQNGSPVWVMAAKAARVYVDYDGDPATGPLTDPNNNKYDVHYDLAALQSQTVYDNSDKDQTGMRLYTLNNVKLTAAWGQDPATAGPGNPYLDMGTTILPLPVPEVKKEAGISIDLNSNGQADPGDTLVYTVTVTNKGAVILGNVIISDTVPAETTYVPNSTKLNGGAVADNGAGAPFPLDQGGMNVGSITVGNMAQVVFKVQIDNPVSPGVTKISNTATVDTDQGPFTVYIETPLQPPTSCSVDFTDAAWASVVVYQVNGTVYVQLTDGDQDISAGPDTIEVSVVNQTNNDRETVILTETGNNTGIFRGSVPSSNSIGLSVGDGTVHAKAGQSLGVSFTDPINGDTCADTVQVSPPVQFKPLYLSSGDVVACTPVSASDDFQSNSYTGGSGWLGNWIEVGESNGSGMAYVNIVTDLSSLRLHIDYEGRGAYRSIDLSGMNTASLSFLYRRDGLEGDEQFDVQVSTNGTTWNTVFTLGGSNDGSYQASGAIDISAYISSNTRVRFFSTIGSTGGTDDYYIDNVQISATCVSTIEQELDRIDPVATGDSSAALSNELALTTGSGTVAVSNSSSASTDSDVSSYSFSHNTTGSGQVLLVGVSMFNDGDNRTITNMTYGGQTMTPVGSRSNSDDKVRMEMWRLANPPTGNNTVAITYSGNVRATAAGAITYTGVDLANPTSGFVSAQGDSSNVSLNVTSETGGMVFDTVSWEKAALDASPGAGQSPQWELNPRGDFMGGATTKSGATSVAMSWSNGDKKYAYGAVALNPMTFSSVSSSTFTQTLSMASGFVMPVGGPLTVTTYISGSLGANGTKLVTATLKNNGTTFATLTNPTYNSAAGTLVWTGALAANTTVATGQAVSLIVTTGLATPFQIRYDSATYPSKVSLPTTTVIEVDALGVYDGAYAGGTAIGGGSNGETVYIRTTISDPFGTSDILSATLSIQDACANPPTTVVLTDTRMVASTAATKTYEYPWATPGSCQGTYQITVTAHEGYEGITDSSTTPFGLSFLDLGTPSTTEFTTGNNGPGTEQYAPDQQVCLRTTDADQNLSATTVETISVIVTSSTGGDSETVALTETGVDTGVFSACIPTNASTDPGSGTLYAPPGDNLTVSYTDPDDPGDTSGDTAVVTTLSPQLTINKTLVAPADGTAVVSETVQFVLVVSNPGPTQITTVVLTDTFPSACLSFQSASIAPNTAAAPTLKWNNVGPLAANGGSQSISVFFTATAACAPAINSATASGTDAFSTPVGPVTKAANVTTTRPALAIAKTLISPNPGPATIGDAISFRISITNTGSTTIASLPLSDNYSASCMTFVNATPAANGFGGGSAVWTNLGSLGVGASTSVVVNFIASGPCSPAQNTGLVDNAVDVNGDPVPAVEDDASLVTVAQPPQLAISKRLTDPVSGTARLGNVLTYTVLITNTGPNAITSLVLTDTYDSGFLALKTWSPITPTSNVAGQAVWDTIIPSQPPLLPGQTMTVTMGFTATALTAATTNVITTTGVDQFGQAVGPLSSQADVKIDPAFTPATISGTVWNDTSGDGVWQSGEPPIASGVVITLSNGMTTTPDVNGVYTFTVNAAGIYTLTEGNPVGFTSTGDVDGPNDDTIQVTVASGSVITGRDFLDAQPGALTGKVLYDLAGNGTGTTGIPGVLITLSNGATTNTDANGVYTFTNLMPGAYTITETNPAGYTSASDVQGVPTDDKIVATVTSGTTTTGQNFWDQPPATARLGDLVWNDLDKDGIKDANEPGIPGAKVMVTGYGGDGILGTADDTVITATTDINGIYTATSLLPDTYHVLVDILTLPEGFESVTGPDDQTVSLAIGQTKLDVDFPYYFTGKNNLGDYVWTDTSGNGNWTDEGAQFSNGINGVTVTLYLDDGDGIFDPGSGGDLLLVTTVTTGTGPSGTGFYNFLIPAVTTPQTYWAAPTGAPLAGLALTSGTVFGDAPMLVTNSGASITTVDFGYAQPVTVTGGVYNDPLANMSGATGLAGVVITATLSGGSPVTTTTDASGLYTFTNLMPGSYTIVEGTPVGYESTGDVDGANDDTINLTLTSGNDVTGQNFWDRPGGSIGDLVWYDTDGDGVRDGGEVGIPGVVISLTNSVGGVVTKTTNASGLYSFTELLPGVYTVTVASGTPGGTPIGAVNTSGPDSKSSPYQVTLAANQDVTNADFGYDSPSNYIISKTRMGFDTVRTNAEVSYTIRITNTGQSWLTTVPLSDSFDSRLLQYFSASVPPMGTLHQSPLAWPDVTTTLGDVAPGGAISLTVTFITMRDTTLIAGGVATNTVTAVNPLADPDGPGGPLGELEVLPSKTATATVAILGPTNVSVINTSVRPLTQGDSTQVQVAWQTVNEVDVVGFHIYRRGPGDAVVQVSAAPILAENAGQPNGDLYAFVDPSAVAGEAYVYVLQILLASGGTEEHTLGPVQWTRQIFLPLVVR